MSKIAKSTQNKWFHCQASNPGRKEKEGFDAWLEVERRVATKQRQCALAVGYPTAQEPEPVQTTSVQERMMGGCPRQVLPGTLNNYALYTINM